MIARPEMMRIAAVSSVALVACVGCGSATTTSAPVAAAAPTPSNVAGANEQVVVRLANKGEFQRERPRGASNNGRRLLLRMECEKNGPAMDAYYRPVVAFAREHFISKEDGEVHEAHVLPDTPKPKLGDGVNIVVEPRGALGELRIVHVGPPFYPPGTWWAETGYCLHVLHGGGIATIAVEHVWSSIK
ncbi:MAG: hypothetical protein HOV81_16550 [Kofleriaceae bacterium]|nr:hypothetical protein [Kofleriaceae bacterium]